MKVILEILLIFLLSGLNNIQATAVSKRFKESLHVKSTHARGSTGQNFQNGQSEISEAGEPTDDSTDVKSCKMCGMNFVPKFKGLNTNGAKVSPPYKYPWVVALRDEEETFCVGALINENYILTAAHCLTKDNSTKNEKMEFMTPNELTVAFVTETYRVEPGPPLKEVIPHPEFSYNKAKHDIALLKLSRKITCSKFVNPICLPPPNFNTQIGQAFTIAGWGAEGGENKEASKELKEAKITKVNYSMCEKEFEKDIKSDSYCVKGMRGQSPCHGDSGGPMFDDSLIPGKYHVFGVTSVHSSETCHAEAPVVYTSVSKHIQWIKTVMGSSNPEEWAGESADAGNIDRSELIDKESARLLANFFFELQNQAASRGKPAYTEDIDRGEFNGRESARIIDRYFFGTRDHAASRGKSAYTEDIGGSEFNGRGSARIMDHLFFAKPFYIASRGKSVYAEGNNGGEFNNRGSAQIVDHLFFRIPDHVASTGELRIHGGHGDRFDYGNWYDWGDRRDCGKFGCGSRRGQRFPGKPRPISWKGIYGDRSDRSHYGDGGAWSNRRGRGYWSVRGNYGASGCRSRGKQRFSGSPGSVGTNGRKWCSYTRFPHGSRGRFY